MLSPLEDILAHFVAQIICLCLKRYPLSPATLGHICTDDFLRLTHLLQV